MSSTVEPAAKAEEHHGSFVLSKYRLPEPKETVYGDMVQAVVAACGHEYRTAHYESIVRYLNQELVLGLTCKEERVLTLLLTALSQSPRFKGNLHITDERGENPAAHSVMTAILATEIFRRAGLLTPERQTPEVIGMRLSVILGALVHDMGEILGELSTLDQRSRNSAAEDANFEGEIFKTALRLAYHYAGTPQELLFFKDIKELREAAGINSLSSAHNENFEEVLKKFNPAIAPADQGSMEVFEHAYWLSESPEENGKSSNEKFIGYAIKVSEHMQGTRHIGRFCVRGPDTYDLRLFHGRKSPGHHSSNAEVDLAASYVPYSLRESSVTRGGLKYNENEVAFLFRYADSEAERELARTLRNNMYLTVIENLKITNKVFRRKAPPHPLVQKLVAGLYDEGTTGAVRAERRKFITMLLAQNQSEDLSAVRADRRRQPAAEGGFDVKVLGNLREVETQGRLMDLYWQAIQVGYEPKVYEIDDPRKPGRKKFTGEVLALMDELPPELRKAPRMNWIKAVETGEVTPAAVHNRAAKPA